MSLGVVCYSSNGQQAWGNINTLEIKIAIKTKWFGQIELLPTGMKSCFPVFVYLYKYNFVHDMGENTLKH